MTALPNLYQCWQKAKRAKSSSKRVQRFEEDYLRHLLEIQRRLRAGTYTFGPYKAFEVQEKKHRHVIDAPMKDRVVHWMIYQHLLPIWMPKFIHHTYGNLPGRGTHAAVQCLAQFARGADAKWVLQIDISKYFYSVNHSLLKACVLRFIGDQALRQLIVSLIDSFTTSDIFDELFAPDSMYRTTRLKGMPIGNLPSQLFANIFLWAFDHWVKQTLGVRLYLRYVDDITFLASTKAELLEILAAVVKFLGAMGLTIHPHKIRLAPTAAGVPFLGYVVWPGHVSAGRYIRSRYIKRLREHESGCYDRTDTLQAYGAMLAHTGQTIQRKTACPAT